ncbi:DUF3592 domain-containing protein [Streptomyces sp. NPDC002463]|uniref:DUF3592 domain-containing protein n=1 Tax=Streptomyces sp. NPDC002463 TaxID=3364645 RepID=UPI00369AF4F8
MGDLIAIWLVIIVSVAGCVTGVVLIRSDIGLKRRGIRVDAEVVGVREHEDGDGDVHFYPILRFTPPGGETVRGESYARINEYAAPDTISVVYDPRHPETFNESPGSGIAGGVIALAFCGPCLGAGLWWLFH